MAQEQRQAVDFRTVRRAEARLLDPNASSESAQDGFQGTGLALSGGGIRSATFCLGVLQALAARGKLAAFDYLSTVSGGGYIGAWLSAWVHRTNLAEVQAALGRSILPGEEEPFPLTWLRRYSNYLAPRVGLFSTDSLTLIATWLRNVLLNLLIVVTLLVALMLLPRVALPYVAQIVEDHYPLLGFVAALLGMVVLPAAILVNLVHMERASRFSQFWLPRARGVACTVLLPGTLAAICGSLWLLGRPAYSKSAPWTFFGGAALLLGMVWACWVAYELIVASRGWRSSGWAPKLAGRFVVFAFAGLISLGIAVAMLSTVRNRWDLPYSTSGVAAMLTFGPALFLVVFGVAGSVFVGLAGRAYPEAAREWWSRMNAGFLVIGFTWLGWMSTAFYVPALAEWAYRSAEGWLVTLLSLGWLGSLASTFLGGKTEGLSRAARNNILGVLNAAAIVFLIGFVVVVATLTDFALTSGSARHRPEVERTVSHLELSVANDREDVNAQADVAVAKVPPLVNFVAARMTDLDVLVYEHLLFLKAALVATILTLIVFGWRVDVNKFSLHNLYKNRLIRCYLGASNRDRRAQAFTGFDETDDLALASLRRQRPLPIVNTTLNLAQGKNLAWQERKGAAFALTPLYSGFDLAPTQGAMTRRRARGLVSAASSMPDKEPAPAFESAYRKSSRYAQDDYGAERAAGWRLHALGGFSVGSAIATSGAAVTASRGPSTRPALAFVLTVFNARTGRWSPNPGRRKWRQSSPYFGLLCLLQELFGFSNERSKFVYLSDGGHFDNVGVYELVRRRCKAIWLVDATADPKRTFSDLARAIRQCRVDFGVDVRLSLDALKAGKDGTLPQTSFVAGTIGYGEGMADGTIIYLKPTLCSAAQEPVDVLNYAARSKAFPHQTTADQFFDESQFESYRRLGQYIGEQALDRYAHMLPHVAPAAASPAPVAEPRAPRPMRVWLERLMIANAVIGGLLAWYRCCGQVYAERALGAVSRQLAKVDLLAARLIGSPDLGAVRLRSDYVFVALDNAFIILYTTMFVFGFHWIKRALMQNWPVRLRTGVYCALLASALLGALFDCGENYLSLVGGEAARGWTRWKWIFAGINAAVLLFAYLWDRRREKTALTSAN